MLNKRPGADELHAPSVSARPPPLSWLGPPPLLLETALLIHGDLVEMAQPAGSAMQTQSLHLLDTEMTRWPMPGKAKCPCG